MSKQKKPMFDFIIGNPPYQGANHQQLYPDFYLASRKVGQTSCLIFPTGWQQPKTANNLGKLNKPEIKTDPQIVAIHNKHNVFSGVPGAEWTNVVLWQKDYNNGLDGAQLVHTEGVATPTLLLWDKSQIEKPIEIQTLASLVMSHPSFVSAQSITSVRKPYGFSTDVMDDYDKYNLPPFFETQQNDNDFAVYGLRKRKQVILFAPANYPVPKKSPVINKYKVFIGKAWGNFSDAYLGGAYADIVIASPNEICTENYLESGSFDDFEMVQKHAKYLMTRFARALLYMHKHTQDNSKEKWAAVPIQDYSESWWDLSIEEIDEKLMDKYAVPQNIRDFVKNHIQTKTEANIVNFRGAIC